LVSGLYEVIQYIIILLYETPKGGTTTGLE